MRPGALTLVAPVHCLTGVGPRIAARLEQLQIYTVADLLFHLPVRYQDRSCSQPIGSLQRGTEVLVVGEVLLTEIKYGRRRMLLTHLTDGTGALLLRFFHFGRTQQQTLTRGVRLQCFGEVRQGPTMLEMVHPEYRILAPDEAPETVAHLTPLYPATEGIRQTGLRKLTAQALDLLQSTGGADSAAALVELLPAEMLAQYRLPGLVEALCYVHRPPLDAALPELLAGSHPMQRRLAFEELLAHQFSLRRLRWYKRSQEAPPLSGTGRLMTALRERLPFTLTAAQQRVIGEIRHDLNGHTPMQRLVQGDVGSGKTIVAAMAVLQAVEAGYQAVVMAPTELLAEQHWQNFHHWLEPLGIKLAWLSGKSRGRVRSAAIARIAAAEAMVVVGTHALFQEDVSFPALGLVVVDEQHRFGVHQRLALREKGRRQGRYPHQLIMTATPIPRTLMMSAYADLDCSLIDELPPGRQPVTTVVLAEHRRETVLQRVREVCLQGRQAYWVCTLIDESEVLQCQAASDTAQQLTASLPELRVGLVHGRMNAREKAGMMADFKAGRIHLLVATTVIEVGVDVPNASLMIIENAERLGLSQLHQLRGRVGRGSVRSVCVLMYHGPLGMKGRTRLAALRECSDGFEIARRDLELRGPGEVLGTRQAGLMQFRTADLLRDQALLPQAADCAQHLLAHYPDCVEPIIRRWLGERPGYTVV